MSGGHLRAVPDERAQIVIDWLLVDEPAAAGPLVDAVVRELHGIPQVRPWPGRHWLDSLRPEPIGHPRRAWLLAAAVASTLVALVGASLLAGSRLPSEPPPQPSPSGSPDPSAGSASLSPAAPSSTADRAVFPLASMPWTIAYATGDTGPLSLIATDGSGRRQLGGDIAGHLVQPDWSANGDRLLVLNLVQDNEQLWEVDPTGRQPSLVIVPCVSPCVARDEASYSVAGDRIAFFEASGKVVDGIPTTCGLRMYTRSSQQISTITAGPCGLVEDRGPRFSPAGDRVAFWRTRSLAGRRTTEIADSALFVRDLRTGKEARLTEWALLASSLDWSPDGAWIVFATHWWDLLAGDAELWRVRPDGSGLERLTRVTDVGAATFRPRYSPDGAWILFSRYVGRAGELWAIPADGGAPLGVLPGVAAGYDFEPGPVLVPLGP